MLGDERTIQIREMADRRAYIVLALAMLFYGLFELIARGQLLELFNLGAVALSSAYLLWQRNGATDYGALDERSQAAYYRQFRVANIGLFLVCILFTFLSGGLWLYLIILPTCVVLVTLFTKRAYLWTAWAVLGALFVLGVFIGAARVLSAP